MDYYIQFSRVAYNDNFLKVYALVQYLNASVYLKVCLCLDMHM